MVMMTREEYYAQIKEMYAQKYESPSMKAWRSGSDHFERSGDDRWFSEEDRRFREYLMSRNDDDDETWTWTEHYSVMDDETDWWYRSEKEDPEDQSLDDGELVEIEAETKSSGIEDRAVENEANSKMISAIVKEESIPQFLMVTEADSTCVQHTNVILQQVSISALEHSLNFCKANLDVMGNCQYAMGKTHQIWSDSNFGCVNDDACQVFDVIHMRTKALPREHKKRFHKSWRFKFKDKVQPSKVIQEQLGVHEGNATRNQLRSPSGFVVDDSHSGFGSDIWCVQYLVGSVVVEDFQETQWLFNGELKDNQIFQILIEEGSNSSAYQKFNGMRIGSWLKAPYVKLETKSFLEIESLQEDVQLVLLDFLHVNVTEPRYAIGERDEMLEVARDVNKRSMLGLTFGIRESNAGEDQRAVCEQIIKVNVWLYQISLVLQQVMRSKKIKFPKRWMFKYKYGKEGIQRLQIQLRYKSWLESGHWLGYNLIVAYLRNKKTWAKLRVRELDNFTWEEDASEVGIDKEHSCSSLRVNQIWDPGGKFLYITQGSTSTLQRRISLPCCTNIFLLNLEVKVSLKGEDVIQENGHGPFQEKMGLK